jgi:UDP-N-acetyl-D-glucosamine/UDP-N-acetyl-D-galactosamine dehydrogenase
MHAESGADDGAIRGLKPVAVGPAFPKFTFSMSAKLPTFDTTRIAVIGLGYVGLPLAVEFGKQFDTLGFEIDAHRISELRAGQDRTAEVTTTELKNSKRLRFATAPAELSDCNVYIVAVPTPVDRDKRPDFSPLVKASQTVGAVLKKGDVVIYESTVYPGATEEICVPELECTSGLALNVDFFVGYSPERVNPGDRERRLINICKVTSGSTPEAAEFVDTLYRHIIKAGTHRVGSIKVAEASKVIENTQRDANIALVNEFALIFQRLGIDTHEVLMAAGTKWNFLPFKPGLVGGHCIGVDPYYLIQKAQSVGYFPDVLLACRRINDAMGRHVAAEVVKLLIKKGHPVAQTRALVLGLTFKENCADLRNTRVIDLVRELESYGIDVDIHDPHADAIEAQKEYGVTLLGAMPSQRQYHAIILAVAHDSFRQMGVEGLSLISEQCAVIYDIKGVFDKDSVDGRL